MAKEKTWSIIIQQSSAISTSTAAVNFSQFLSSEDLLQVKGSRFKMILFVWYIIASLMPVAGAWGEFGRRPEDERNLLHVQRRRMGDGEEHHNRLPRTFDQHQQDINELKIIEVFEEMLDGNNFMSLSMSMLMPQFPSGDSSREPSTTPPPSSSSQFPTAVTPFPTTVTPTTASPTVAPSSNDGTTANPTGTASTTSEPTSTAETSSPTEGATTETAAPTAVSTPTSTTTPPATGGPTPASPTTEGPTPEPTSTTGEPITFAPTIGRFECSAGGRNVGLGDATDTENTVVIFLRVGYNAESTSNNTNDFIDELELELARTALNAALGCDEDDGGDFVEDGSDILPFILVQSFEDDIDPTCEPTQDEADFCTILETEIVFFVKGEVDPDLATFDSYKSIEESMTNDSYIGIVPTVVKLEYLSPLNLPEPPQSLNEPGTNPPQATLASARSSRFSLSPVTIGACIATIMGALVSITVWSRNRRARNRHMQLSEESLESDSRNAVTI